MTSSQLATVVHAARRGRRAVRGTIASLRAVFLVPQQHALARHALGVGRAELQERDRPRAHRRIDVAAGIRIDGKWVVSTCRRQHAGHSQQRPGTDAVAEALTHSGDITPPSADTSTRLAPEPSGHLIETAWGRSHPGAPTRVRLTATAASRHRQRRKSADSSSVRPTAAHDGWYDFLVWGSSASQCSARRS